MSDNAVIIGAANGVARRLRHVWITESHVLLGILEGPPVPGRRALEAAGLTVDAVEAELLTGQFAGPGHYEDEGLVKLGPALALLARAQGVAIARGLTDVRAEHVLIALIWHEAGTATLDLLGRCGVTTEAIRDALVSVGVSIPALPLPETVEVQYGPEVFGPADRFDEVFRHLGQVVGHRFNWSWNVTDDDRFVVHGEDAADLPGIVTGLIGTERVEVDETGRRTFKIDSRHPHAARYAEQ
ncbi:MAG: Clp protease N-terminal domain-containing protein [Egicoccus sp.]